MGRWARVEGTPNDPNPNDPRAHMDSESLFKDGKLLPAITILGMASLGTRAGENLHRCWPCPVGMGHTCVCVYVCAHVYVCLCLFL